MCPLIDGSDESGEPVRTANDVGIGEGNHGVAAREIGKSGDLIVHLLPLPLRHSCANESHASQTVVLPGVCPDGIAGSCLKVFAQPLGDGIVPRFKTNDDPVVGVVLAEDRIKKPGGGL